MEGGFLTLDWQFRWEKLCVVVVACKTIVSAPVPVCFLRTLDLDLGLRTWTWAWQSYIFINVYKCQMIFLSLKLNWQPWKLLSVNRIFETSIKCEDKFAIDLAVIDIFSAPPLIFMLFFFGFSLHFPENRGGQTRV